MRDVFLWASLLELTFPENAVSSVKDRLSVILGGCKGSKTKIGTATHLRHFVQSSITDCRSDALRQTCQTQARGPNLTCGVIIFGPRDNIKCVLELPPSK